MKKKINIVLYDPKWPETFKILSDELKDILKENCIQIYHIGSTSVPGLCAKPVIDILCVVKDLKSSIPALEAAGYKYKGELNLPLRLFFNKKEPYDLNLHVVKESNGEIQWQVNFRDYLRSNKTARDLYAQTKINLIKKNPDGFEINKNQLPEYTILKGEVIKHIARMSGFREYRFVIASNHDEIESYKRLMDLEKLDFDDKNIFHLCLYKGVDIVAAACVKFDAPNHKALINSIKSDCRASEKILIDKINEWAEFHDLTISE